LLSKAWRLKANAVYWRCERQTAIEQDPLFRLRVPMVQLSKTMRTTKNPFSLSASKEPDRLAEIYRAAAQIICDKGYDATSMNDIAEAVGITKSGLYHHVSGKRNLLFSIMNFGMDSLEEQVIAPARAIADAEQRLRTIITNHVHLITSRSTSQGNNPVTIVVDEVAGLTVAQRRKIDQRKRAYVDLIREALSELKESEKLRDLDVIAATFSLLGMILWLSRWYSPEGRLTPDQVSDEVTKIALSGLLRPEA
jgi:AcrR family transcriptional regulator